MRWCKGRPAPISFNVSHSGEHGLIAFAEQGRLGVDVEERSAQRNLDGLIRTVLGPAEQAELEMACGNHKLHLFFNLWTIKEALIKALGTGLSLDMSRFEVPSAMRRGETTSMFQFPHLPTFRWRLENLGNEHFAAALAHELDPGFPLTSTSEIIWEIPEPLAISEVRGDVDTVITLRRHGNPAGPRLVPEPRQWPGG